MINYFEEYDKKEIDKIEFDNQGRVIFKGILLSITRENIEDYVAQTGMDAMEMVKWAYNNSIPVVRDRKLEELLS